MYHNPTQFPIIYGASALPAASAVPVGIITFGDMTQVLTYAMQSTWSNNDPNGECVISHVIEGSSIGAPSFDTPQVVQRTSFSVTYRVGWTSVSNATSYAVWELWNGYPSSGSFSYYSSFSTTDIEVGVPKGSWVYLEVQACNASECGNFSGQEELVY